MRSRARLYIRSQKALSVGLSSLVAGVLLFIIYGGLCYLGATGSGLYPADTEKGALVSGLVGGLFGRGQQRAAGCDHDCFVHGNSGGADRHHRYLYFAVQQRAIQLPAVAVTTGLFSMVISNVGLDSIISLAAPVLIFLYPGTLAVIVLSLFDKFIKNDNIFRFATVGALLSSGLSVLEDFGLPVGLTAMLPFESVGLGWILSRPDFWHCGIFCTAGQGQGLISGSRRWLMCSRLTEPVFQALRRQFCQSICRQS